MAYAPVLSGQVALGTALPFSFTGSATRRSSVDESIATGQTDKLVQFVSDISTIALFVMISDQNITVETNSGSAADKSFTVLANVPVIWYTGIGTTVTQFLAADVTALYITNASGSTARLQIECYEDATP